MLTNSLIIIFLVVQIIVIPLFYRNIRRFILLNKYKNVVEILNHFLEISYETVYASQLVGYTANGITQIPQDEFETIQRDFIKLTIELMGNQNLRMLIDFYGDRKTLVSNILLYFKKKLSEDQLSSLLKQATPK